MHLFCDLQGIPCTTCLQFGGVVSIPPLSMGKAWSLLPVTVLYVSNVGFALLGLQSLNIPMYNTLKRLTPMLVLGAKVNMPARGPIDGMQTLPVPSICT